MLELKNIEVIYSDVILVLKGTSLEVPEGKIVALLGANGAGKTTTLKAISGILRTELGEVTDGTIEFEGERLDRLDPEEVVRRGIVQVMEGQRLFEHLTVEENLIVGAYLRKDTQGIREDLTKVYDYFPILAPLKRSVSGYISGGERQMVVMGRAMMALPKIMLLDEPSMGLSPLLVKEIFKLIRQINEQEGVGILLVEQNARIGLALSTHGYVMESGRIVLDGPSEKLMENEDVKEFYLGLSEMGKRKSYRDVKHYKRRKRWLA
ncbi:MAG: ABC transporter ATP-binding protein [Deltaproteobacteria bacterium]|nr:ABC transporter ATP-binding protein [Deltaproteobacteria bacterium]